MITDEYYQQVLTGPETWPDVRLAKTVLSLGWRVVCMSPCMPVQYQGISNRGEHLYFRARWDAWYCCIADTFDHTIVGFEPDSPGVLGYWEGEYINASHMPAKDAGAIILRCLEAYEQGKGRAESQGLPGNVAAAGADVEGNR